MCAEFAVGSMALSATLGESDAISSAVLPTALALNFRASRLGPRMLVGLRGAMLLGGFPGLQIHVTHHIQYHIYLYLYLLSRMTDWT